MYTLPGGGMDFQLRGIPSPWEFTLFRDDTSANNMAEHYYTNKLSKYWRYIFFRSHNSFSIYTFFLPQKSRSKKAPAHQDNPYKHRQVAPDLLSAYI